MYPRHELIDYQRLGCNIYVAPSSFHLAAVTDSLGRIILLDTTTGLLLRMWKGYRDAQCGFTEVTEARNRKDQSTDCRRSGLFLIIYAPRKAILEIWCLQKGPKVATFQASKHGFLIYNSHDNSHQKSSRHAKTSCLFFDSDDNSLKNFAIPFHCILSETNSKSAEDFHYLKRLKMTLKNVDLKDPAGVNNVLELCEKLQTPEIKLKCLELLTSYRKTEPHVIKAVIEIFLKVPQTTSEIVDEQHEDEIQDGIYRKQLEASCLNLQSLVNCYLLTKESPTEDSEQINNESMELLDNEYLTVQRIVELMSFSKSKHQSSTAKNVSFKDNEESIVSFLTSFIVNLPNEIPINFEHHQSAFDNIGSVLFTTAWKEQLPMSKLLDVFETSRMESEDIMKCFLHFWLQQEINFTDEDHVLAEMTKFKHVLEQVCVSAGEKVSYAYNSICLFWQDIREYLLESNNPINSLLAAIICKNYALKKQDENQDFGFEQVTQEECQWTLLNEKLNDVAVLSIFVSQFGSGNNSLKEKYEAPNISLKKILNDGKGIISELVACWLIGVNLPINLIFKSSADEGLEVEEKNVIKKLEILRQHFPYSLNGAVILCYVIWELLSCRWSKNLSEMQYLRKGIENLELFEEKDYHLKQGLCVMLWNANFKIPLKATQKLINKTGRLPKEKLCLQNTMIPDFLIPQFLEQTLVFLDHFRGSMNYNKFEFKCEEILKQGSSAPSLSLCELILQQSRGNSPLLNLHYEMIKVLELIAFLNLKYTKPMNALFDDVSNEAFFMDINKQLPYAILKADELRTSTRLHFLKKALTASMDLIIESQKTYFDDHLKWVEKVKKVGEIWTLDGHQLERHHVSFSLSVFW